MRGVLILLVVFLAWQCKTESSPSPNTVKVTETKEPFEDARISQLNTFYMDTANVFMLNGGNLDMSVLADTLRNLKMSLPVDSGLYYVLELNSEVKMSLYSDFKRISRNEGYMLKSKLAPKGETYRQLYGPISIVE